MRGCHLHLRSRPQRFCGRIHRGPVWTDLSLAPGVNPSRPRESGAESARVRLSPLTLARFSSWMISASTSSVASSPDCSAAAAGRENQASAARSGSEVTGTGPRPRPPARPAPPGSAPLTCQQRQQSLSPRRRASARPPLGTRPRVARPLRQQTRGASSASPARGPQQRPAQTPAQQPEHASGASSAHLQPRLARDAPPGRMRDDVR